MYKKSQEDNQTKKIIQNKNLGCQMNIWETNSDLRWKKDYLQILVSHLKQQLWIDVSETMEEIGENQSLVDQQTDDLFHIVN